MASSALAIWSACFCVRSSSFTALSRRSSSASRPPASRRRVTCRAPWPPGPASCRYAARRRASRTEMPSALATSSSDAAGTAGTAEVVELETRARRGRVRGRGAPAKSEHPAVSRPVRVLLDRVGLLLGQVAGLDGLVEPRSSWASSAFARASSARPAFTPRRLAASLRTACSALLRRRRSRRAPAAAAAAQQRRRQLLRSQCSRLASHEMPSVARSPSVPPVDPRRRAGGAKRTRRAA